jgi:LPS export ABC transporter protein LptC
MDRIRLAALIAGVIMVVVVVIMINLGSKKKNISLIPAKISGRPDVEMTDFRFFSTKAGRVEWEIQAKFGSVFEKRHEAMLRDIQVTFRNPNGMGMTLQGEEGILDTISRDFQITNQNDPIKVTLDQDYQLYTSTLDWVNGAREIRSDAPVRILGPNLQVEGRGFLASLNLQEMQVLDDIVAHFRP